MAGEPSEHRELLDGIFENAPIGMAVASVPAGRFLRVNPALCEIVAYSEAELLERTFLDITHPGDAGRDLAQSRRLLAGRTRRYESETRYVRRDGHEVWAALSVSLLRDEAGAPRYFLAQIADISERKRVEQALLAERDHSAAIIAAMAEGYALVVDGRVIEVNDALCQLTGYTWSELIGGSEPWPFWPDDEPRVDFVEAAGGARPVVIAHKDGRRIDMEIAARAAHRPDGSVLGWVMTMRDTSERRRYESELERLATHDHLTGLANSRLFHERLREAMAAAVRHDRLLSVAVFDLDYFKEINDTHGHVAGDRVLRSTADRLGAVVREGELLARVGGEEFAWILPDAGLEGAFAAAERGRRAVSLAPVPPAGRVRMSAGVSTRGDLRDADVLYRRADDALYRAKRDGRDRTVRWA